MCFLLHLTLGLLSFLRLEAPAAVIFAVFNGPLIRGFTAAIIAVAGL
jgi:hypothetical protein